MIKVSEMYRISGGCDVKHKCSECANCIGEKDLTCIAYTKDYGATWNRNRIACKYFRVKENNGQIDISDLVKVNMAKN